MQEFRRYRLALSGIYFTALALSCLLVLASIIHELFLQRSERGPVPTPADLVECNRRVRGLLEDLGRTAAALQGEAVAGHGGDLGRRWEAFTRDWQRRWDTVDLRCQFDRLADTGLGPAFDRMAWVHRSLPTVKLKYRAMMKRFTDEQAGELTEMRRALDQSERLLRERAGVPPAPKRGSEDGRDGSAGHP